MQKQKTSSAYESSGPHLLAAFCVMLLFLVGFFSGVEAQRPDAEFNLFFWLLALGIAITDVVVLSRAYKEIWQHTNRTKSR